MEAEIVRGPWSQQEDAQLIEMRRANQTAAQIAAALHRTVPAVQLRAQKIRAKRGNDGRWTADENRRLVEMRRRGVPSKIISHELGRSLGAVERRIRNLKMPAQIILGEKAVERRVRLGSATMAKVQAHLNARQISFCRYVRNLIIRDLGL